MKILEHIRAEHTYYIIKLKNKFYNFFSLKYSHGIKKRKYLK